MGGKSPAQVTDRAVDSSEMGGFPGSEGAATGQRSLNVPHPFRFRQDPTFTFSSVAP
jgi:hypothetical protein